MTTTTTAPAGSAPSWFDRHVAATTDPRPARPANDRATTPAAPATTPEDTDGEEG